MLNRIVGIIGIKGKFGRWLERFFIEQDCAVIGSDVGTPLTNQQVVEQAEVVVFSLPIRFVEEEIRSLIGFSRPNQLWMDVTSVKKPAVTMMLQSRAEVVGLHPMCAPTVSTLRGQKLVYHPARLTEKWRSWVEDFIRATNGMVKIATPEEHDRYMAVVQGAPHALILVMAAMIRELGVSVPESMDYTSPFYRVVFCLMGRILGQKPDLYADIQMGNSVYVLPVLEALETELQGFLKMVRKKDRVEFAREFEASRKYFGANVAEASDFFDALIKLMADLSDENMLVLIVSNDKPGTLYQITGILAGLGINLTSLHTQKIADGKHKFLVGIDQRKDTPIILEACRQVCGIPCVEIVV